MALHMHNHNEFSPKWPYSIARLGASVSIIVGAIVLIGWTFYFWLSDDLKPFIIAIKPNTAICLVLAGIALWKRCERKEGYSRYLAEICSAAILLISFLTLFEYFFQINIGIDQGIFKDALATAGTFSTPGRMSPVSACNFILIGFVLFNLDSKSISYRVHQLLISIAMLIAFFTLLGHLYKIGTFAQVFGVTSQYSEAGIPVLLTFLLLDLGVFFARPYKGIAALIASKASGGTLARRLLPPALVIPILLGYLQLLGKEWGIFPAEIGITLLIMGITIFFVVLVLFNANSINRVDIKRQEAEFALKRNQMQLQGILDNVNAIIYIFDIDGRLILANKQFEKIFHKSIFECVGRKLHEIFPQEHAEKFIENNNSVIRTRDPISIEEVIPHDDGDHTYIANKFPLLNDIGVPYAVGGISTDITEIKRIQEMLKLSEERVSLALRSAEAGTWSWDITKDVIIPDAHMRYLLGLKDGIEPGHFEAVLRLIHPKDRERLDEEVRKALKKNTEFETEFRILQRNGQVRYLIQRGKIYRDDTGRPIRMTGVVWDITQSKQVELELRRAKETAEKLAEKAEEASRAKSAFLAAMSHEIRTPLNGVIGMTGLLLDTHLTEEQLECAETIRVSGEALLSVINDILDFSKIESERLELENADFDLHALIQDSVEILAAHVHRKGIALGAFIEPNVPEWLTGDSSRIRQVITNLVSNATKFTEKGEIGIKVSLINKKEKRVTLKFEVSDTGIGISPEIRERLFQPFTQGDLSISRKYGGTGLGLAICKRLVEIMGGKIDVISVPGRGSTFWFTLHLTECDVHIPKIEYKLLPELHGTRILCVDDNSINREIVKRLTESWEMRCDTAINGGEALSMLKKAYLDKDPYSLILVDYLMPGMDGFVFIQIMRELKEISNTPVIVLSALGSIFNTKELNKLNISFSLTKPLRPTKLYQAIITVIRNSRKLSSPETTPLLAQEETTSKKVARILLAEDNPINLQVATRILGKLGYRADSVGNGYEVLEALKVIPYDLILMDCQMPDMDGYTATEEIRKLELKNKTKHIPIIAMTAHALKGDREKCLASGMDDYISKPINVKGLEVLLERWLTNKIDILQKPNLENTEVTMTTNSSLIDNERLEAIFGDDKNAIKEFMKNFIDSTATLLKEIKTAVTEKNQKTCKETFHRLKGSAGNSGIMGIHELALQAERSVLESDWQEVEKLFKSIEELFIKLEIEVKEKF